MKYKIFTLTICLFLILALTSCSYNNFQNVFDNCYESPIQDKDFVYFIDNARIYRFDTNTSKIELLCSGKTILGIVHDDLYYLDSDSIFHRLSLDSKEETIISNEPIYHAAISDEWVFYADRQDDYNLYKMKLDATDITKLNIANCRKISISGEWIYCVINADLYFVKKHITDDTVEIFRDDNNKYLKVWEYEIYNDLIYYTDIDDVLMSMNLDGSNQKVILRDLKCLRFIIYEDYIYFLGGTDEILHDNNTEPHKIKIDGTEFE